jgi:hypothetical protein
MREIGVALKRFVRCKVLPALVAATAIALALRPGAAETLPWKDACVAIQPTIACTAANRPAIEDAMTSCRKAEDKPACHRRYLIRQQERPATAPRIIRGGRAE